MSESIITILSNGNGSYFVRCHCCQRTSPGHDAPDDLHVLTAAQKAGWTVRRIGSEHRLFCELGRCQTQAG